MKKIPIFFCLFTLVVLFFTLRPVYQLAVSWSWQKSSCTIISSGLKSGGSKRSASFRVAAVYSYRFNDRDYTSENFDFTAEDYDSAYQMKKVITRYAPGQTVDCYVNPENPGEAVISRSIRQIPFLGILVVSILFLVGFASLIYAFVKKPK